jgi:hypothetical protein
LPPGAPGGVAVTVELPCTLEVSADHSDEKGVEERLSLHAAEADDDDAALKKSRVSASP